MKAKPVHRKSKEHIGSVGFYSALIVGVYLADLIQQHIDTGPSVPSPTKAVAPTLTASEKLMGETDWGLDCQWGHTSSPSSPVVVNDKSPDNTVHVGVFDQGNVGPITNVQVLAHGNRATIVKANDGEIRFSKQGEEAPVVSTSTYTFTNGEVVTGNYGVADHVVIYKAGKFLLATGCYGDTNPLSHGQEWAPEKPLIDSILRPIGLTALNGLVQHS